MRLRKERLVWVLHASTFFFFLGIAVVNPLVSPVSIQLGATPFVVGVVAAIASVFSLTFKPIGGLLGDRGMRLGIMMTGALAGAIAAVLYLTSDLTGSIIIF
ncbi:MAG: MFS transporter, partial [Thermococci archaeon]|nr:MFS transporter [Thermococci archaeon]